MFREPPLTHAVALRESRRATAALVCSYNSVCSIWTWGVRLFGPKTSLKLRQKEQFEAWWWTCYSSRVPEVSSNDPNYAQRTKMMRQRHNEGKCTLLEKKRIFSSSSRVPWVSSNEPSCAKRTTTMRQSHNEAECTLVEKKRKFSSSIRIFRRDQVQVLYEEGVPNIWGNVQYLVIHEEAVSHIFSSDPFWISL